MAILQDNFIEEGTDLLPPSDDRIFKALLTHPDAKQVLIDIISTVIEQKVTEVEIRNNELPVMDIEEKAERFDVNCTVDGGDQVNVEMHCSKGIETGIKRTDIINKYTYYMTDLHSSQTSKGKAYNELVKTYQITFFTYSVFPEHRDFASWFTLRTKNGEQFTDQINLIIVELDKLNEALGKPVECLTSFEKWSLFLKFAPDPMHRGLINDIIKDKKEINMAATLLREISKDDRERAILRSRRMAETDRFSEIRTAEMIGEERAREKWQVIVAENEAEIARKNAEIEQLRSQLAEHQANK